MVIRHAENHESPASVTSLHTELVNLATVVNSLHVAAAECDRRFRRMLATSNPNKYPDVPLLLDYLIHCRMGEESLLDTSERVVLEQAMVRCNNKQLAASELLGLSPRVINYRLQKLGLRPKDRKAIRLQVHDENTHGDSSFVDQRR